MTLETIIEKLEEQKMILSTTTNPRMEGAIGTSGYLKLYGDNQIRIVGLGGEANTSRVIDFKYEIEVLEVKTKSGSIYQFKKV